MGSLSRKEFIPPDKELEMFFPQIRGGEAKYMKTNDLLLTRGNEQIIEKYHHQSAVRHWTVMRTVLPDAIWENW
jgi:hypothetical protein